MDLIPTVSASIRVCKKETRGARTPRAAVSRDVMRCGTWSIDPSLCWNMPCECVNKGQGPDRSGLQTRNTTATRSSSKQLQLRVITNTPKGFKQTCFWIRFIFYILYKTIKGYKKLFLKILFVDLFAFVFHEPMLELYPEVLRSENTNASFWGLFFMTGIIFLPPQIP